MGTELAVTLTEAHRRTQVHPGTAQRMETGMRGVKPREPDEAKLVTELRMATGARGEGKAARSGRAGRTVGRMRRMRRHHWQAGADGGSSRSSQVDPSETGNGVRHAQSSRATGLCECWDADPYFLDLRAGGTLGENWAVYCDTVRYVLTSRFSLNVTPGVESSSLLTVAAPRGPSECDSRQRSSSLNYPDDAVAGAEIAVSAYF
ncbi:hypothetical protein N7532_003792 [Penicillium argentinense]|uniref:Uncharacterized protein n=1 Tax=Penicillium argentinense TaxID=1131581 RepID=A0A9W9FNA1_9EURO|nr:uncharacterized protein N7532_003792 [Penicillium argentinense]KAJ5103263.1 hypothetical protein N7532_003792 [Penicillium argentinense]